MDTPFFSIIIPVYKVRQDYLEMCVESIRNQSFCNLEVILVDDGSPDNCGAICDEYAKKDTRIKVLHQKNQGVSAARNAGIEAAQGEWIMFVDADDWVEEGSYEKLATHVCNCDYDILMFRLVRVYENQAVALTYPFEPNRIYDTSICEDKEVLYRLAMRTPKSGNSVVYYSVDKVIRREFLNTKKLRYPVGLPKSEDKVFVLQCFEKLRKFCFMDEAYYFYRINVDSVCNRYSGTADMDRLQLARMLLPIANRMDTELGNLKGDKDYSVLTNDCKRFLFGIISDVFSLKFFHPDCPYSREESKAMAKKFMKTEPFHSCIQDVKYDQLSISAKLKRFLLQHGWVGTYNSIYKLMLRLSNKRAQNR